MTVERKTSVSIRETDLERLYALKINRREPLYEVLHRLIDEYLRYLSAQEENVD